MERGIFFFDVGDEFFPDFAFEELAGSDRFADQFGSLGEYPAGTDGVVTDFAVAHVIIRRHTDGGTVGFEAGHRAACHKFTIDRHIGFENGIAVSVFTEADTIEYSENHRAAPGGEAAVFFQTFQHDKFPFFSCGDRLLFRRRRRGGCFHRIR